MFFVSSRRSWTPIVRFYLPNASVSVLEANKRPQLSCRNVLQRVAFILKSQLPVSESCSSGRFPMDSENRWETIGKLGNRETITIAAGVLGIHESLQKSVGNHGKPGVSRRIWWETMGKHGKPGIYRRIWWETMGKHGKPEVNRRIRWETMTADASISKTVETWREVWKSMQVPPDS